MRRVICAALKYNDLLILGPRHFDLTMHGQISMIKGSDAVLGSDWAQGFIDQFGVYLDRVEALKVAEEAGQLLGRFKYSPLDELCSEDLY